MDKSSLGDTFRSALSSAEVMAALVGGVLAWWWGWPVQSMAFAYDPSGASIMALAWGARYAEWWAWWHVVAGSVIAVSLVRIGESFMSISRPSAEDEAAIRSRDGFHYVLPPWPQERRTIRLVIGEVHEPSGNWVERPAWYVIPELGCFGNVGIFGGIGSGKTSGIAYPLLRQILEFRCNDHLHKAGGLILDVKGNFAKSAQKIAEEYGRGSDVVVVAPGGRYRWNPIHAPSISTEVLAGRLLAVMENLSGGGYSGESAWVGAGVRKLVGNCIGLHRLSYGYVTIADIDVLIGRTAGLLGESDEDPVMSVIKEYDKAFNARGMGEEEKRDYAYHRRFFVDEWRTTNERNKGTWVSAATDITGLFSKPEIAETFCPPEAAIDFPGFPSLVDDGRVVMLGMPDGKWGAVAKSVGILMKLEFQRAVLSRVARDDANTQRPVFSMIDEYQNFVTVSGSTGEGDDNFFALSRESKAVNIILTQAPVSLIAKVGKEKARVLLASLRTKVFLSITDPEDQEWAANVCGKRYADTESIAYREQVQNARWDPITKDMAGSGSTVSEDRSYREELRHDFLPADFGVLPSFCSIVSGFDGRAARAPSMVYLHPDFADRETPYIELSASFAKAAEQDEEGR